MPVTQIQPQFRRPPYRSPMSQQMPGFMMQLLSSYFQNKYASQRQKDQWDRELIQRNKEVDAAKQLQKERYWAKKEENFIEVDIKNLPEGMEPSQTRVGRYGKTWAKKPFEPRARKLTMDGKEIWLLESGPNKATPLKFPGPGWETSRVGKGEKYPEGTVIAKKSGEPDQIIWEPDKEKGPTRYPLEMFRIGPQGSIIKTEAYNHEDELTLIAAKFKRGDPTPKGEPPTTPSLIQQYKLAQEEGYPGTITDWKKEVAKAGATKIDLGPEKWETRKGVSAGEIRTELKDNRADKSWYDANGYQFNNTSVTKEVMYWDDVPTVRKWRKDKPEAKIVSLTAGAIADGWTPQLVQKAANTKEKTVKQVLIDLGVL